MLLQIKTNTKTWLGLPTWPVQNGIQHVHVELGDWFCTSVSLQVSNGDLDGFTLVHQNVHSIPESGLKQLSQAFPSLFMFSCKDGKVYGSVSELVCEKFLVDCERKKYFALQIKLIMTLRSLIIMGCEHIQVGGASLQSLIPCIG